MAVSVGNMRIPYLRLVDDEGARDATVEVLREAAKEHYELRGFEWPLVRRVLEARYNRLGDVGFLFGFTTVACMRWAVSASMREAMDATLSSSSWR